MLADLRSLVHLAVTHEGELRPHAELVDERFDAWLMTQQQNGRLFTADQRQWLNAIRDHIATSLRIEKDDFDETPFSESGGLGKFYEVFGNEMDSVLDELNEALAALVRLHCPMDGAGPGSENSVTGRAVELQASRIPLTGKMATFPGFSPRI